MICITGVFQNFEGVGGQPLAEATSCRAAIRAAKGVVEDIGHLAAKRSPGLSELARCHQHASECDVHVVVAKKYKLSLPIPMTRLEKPLGVVYAGNICMLALKDWAQYLIDFNLQHMLVGLRKPDRQREAAILRAFWARYRILKPKHKVFELSDSGQLQLGRTYPMLLHGDEGRGRKKSGFLVVSYTPYMGLGTNEANNKRETRHYINMRLNYSGSAYIGRFLTAVLPKMFRDESALLSILEQLATDSCYMLSTGVKGHDGEIYKMAVLQCSGDWQWLAKAGHLNRSYSNVEKRPRKVGAVPKGICHLCQAGQVNIDWENFRADRAPCWWRTRFVERAFERQPALCRLCHMWLERLKGFSCMTCSTLITSGSARLSLRPVWL